MQHNEFCKTPFLSSYLLQTLIFLLTTIDIEWINYSFPPFRVNVIISSLHNSFAVTMYRIKQKKVVPQAIVVILCSFSFLPSFLHVYTLYYKLRSINPLLLVVTVDFLFSQPSSWCSFMYFSSSFRHCLCVDLFISLGANCNNNDTFF